MVFNETCFHLISSLLIHILRDSFTTAVQDINLNLCTLTMIVQCLGTIKQKQ